MLSYMVAGEIKSSRLVPLLESHAPPSVPVHLIDAQRRIIAPKVRAFIDFAVPRLRKKLAVPARLRRTGMETKLIVQGAFDPAHRNSDRSLLRLIAMARRFNELVTTGAGLTVTELAIQAGVSRSYFSRILRLSFLAPEITKAIVQGRQPSEFSAIKLMGAGQFAGAWSDQRRQLGFD